MVPEFLDEKVRTRTPKVLDRNEVPIQKTAQTSLRTIREETFSSSAVDRVFVNL